MTTAHPDPQALIKKHADASGAASPKDAAIIEKVEGALANSPMGWLNSMLGETSSKASTEEGAAKDKADEFDSEVEKNKKDAPKDAGAPPPKGQATKPSVQTPASAKAGDQGAAGKKGGEGKGGKTPAKAGGKGGKGGKGGAASAAAVGDSIVAKLAAGDGDIGALLDAYTPKSPEAKETLGKISQMAGIAKGFSGSLDVYVADGGMEGAIATAANWIGEGKNVAAVWANNPYKKADGTLGTIMKVLSVIKSVTGIVGSICGKLGLILTVIGLLGMIFPPIGAAVSGIARILNVVGLICDAISFVLSAVLTGLNGVRLAQLIASGATPEEKAACADQLVSEANDAASGLISLAMQYGPKFMKGMLGKSKGILNGLLKRAKAVIGQITAKVGGNVKNFVNKIVRKLGFGGVKGSVVKGVFVAEKGVIARAGDAIKNSKVVTGVKSVVTKVKGSKVWNKPADLVKGARDKLMAKYGDSKFAKWCNTVGAKSSSFADKLDLEKKAEELGEKAGKWGENWQGTKSLNAGTDKIEKESAAYAKHLANQDMGHLADSRKERLLGKADDLQAKNDAMKADGVNRAGRSSTLNDRNMATQQAGNVGKATKEEVEQLALAAEKKAADDLAAAEAKELKEKAQRDLRNADPEKYAEDATKNSKDRFQKEHQLAKPDAERKKLLEMGEDNLTDAQKKRLKDLNTSLKPLDDARALDDLTAKTVGGGKYEHAMPKNTVELGKTGYEAFKTGREAYDTWLHPGEDRPTERGKSWDSAEKFDFKDPLKWDSKSAASNASKRAGDEAKGLNGPEVKAPEDTSKADFHSFVAKKAAASSIGATATSMLGRIKKKDAGASGNSNANASPTSANATPPANANAHPPANANAHPPANANAHPPANANAHPPGNANAAPPAATPEPVHAEPTPHADPAAGAAGAAAGGAGGEGGEGGEPLPYWPALEKDYNKALGEFGLMRKIAIEFKKAQIGAKQQAVDTLATYGKYDEYAAKRQADAKAHSADTHQAGAAVDANSKAATAGETSSGQGAAKQDEAKGTAGQKAAVDLPEPEVSGFWGRIIGRIKRWAKQKAAELFGWIQEKIANIILKGLCGVSMADLKAYSGAMKNQQAAAKVVADTGAKTADTAAAKEVEVKTTSQTETSKAEADIAECDKNTTDADVFLSDVNNFEQQLKAEAANAASFITAITAAVTEERNKKKAEEAKAKEEEAKAAATAAQPNQSVEPNQSTAANDEHESHEGEGEEDDPASLAIVSETKAYVGSAGDSAVTALESKRDDYKNQIEASTMNKDKKLAKAIEPQAEEIITEFKGHVTEVRQNLETLNGAGDEVVQAIIGQAKGLDSAIAQANQTMDQMFTTLYDKIKSSKMTLGKQALAGVNDLGSGVNSTAQRGLNAAEPGAEKAWSGTKDVVGAVGNPIGNAAEWTGSKMVGGAAWLGAGTTVGMAQSSGVPMIP